MNIPTATTLVTIPNPSNLGQVVNLLATVTAGTGTPTGMVTFFNGNTSIGSANLNATGTGSLDISDLPLGNNNLSSSYGGDSTYSASQSNIIVQTVANLIPTTSTLSTTPNPSGLGQTVELLAEITATTGIPTGGVDFFNGKILLGSAPLGATGTAGLSVSDLPLGENILSIFYGGNFTFESSISNTVLQTVTDLIPTTTTVTSNPNPSVVNSPVTFTAQVEPTTPTVPTGDVLFTGNGVTLGTVSLDGNGVATLMTSALPIGNNTIIAFYRGDSTYEYSASPFYTQVVTSGSPSVTTLISSSNPSWYGQSVTFTAIVIGAITGTTAGTVTFFVNGAAVATVSVNTSGAAVYTTATLLPGSSSLVAIYNGGTGLAPSTSNTVVQIVMFCCPR